MIRIEGSDNGPLSQKVPFHFYSRTREAYVKVCTFACVCVVLVVTWLPVMSNRSVFPSARGCELQSPRWEDRKTAQVKDVILPPHLKHVLLYYEERQEKREGTAKGRGSSRQRSQDDSTRGTGACEEEINRWDTQIDIKQRDQRDGDSSVAARVVHL